MKYKDALSAAHWMINYLRPSCLGASSHEQGISIAGSLRRGVEKDYSEIDLVMIPDLTVLPFPRPEFGRPVPKVYPTKLDKLLGELQEAGRLYFEANGPRATRFNIHGEGFPEIKFDLYIVRPPATWGVQLLIRTGPEDFGHWIVTRRSGSAHSNKFGRVRGGALPDGYRVQAGAVWEGEEKEKESELLQKTPIGFDTEESFLSWLGLDWLEPGDRVARWGSREGIRR
jgi:hypothetical protein